MDKELLKTISYYIVIVEVSALLLYTIVYIIDKSIQKISDTRIASILYHTGKILGAYYREIKHPIAQITLSVIAEHMRKNCTINHEIINEINNAVREYESINKN